MMTDLITKTNLESIAIQIDAHGKVAIESILTVGKLLCDAREILPSNNEFGEWRENRLPWIKPRMSQRWMNAYKNGGENLLRHNVATTVLYELTGPEVPESAREEAGQHNELTVKQSKEIAQANKRIAELQKECDQLKTPPVPNLDNLIPELNRLFRSGSIVLARAKQLSVLLPDKQDIYLQEFHSKEFHRKAAEKAKEDARVANEKALKAIEEKEKALKQLQRLSGTDNAQLIARQKEELKALREEYQKKLDEDRKDIERQALESNKEEIKKAYDAKDKAEKKANKADDDFKAISTEHHKLQAKVKTLEEQLEVDSPSNIDAAHAERLKDILESFQNRLIRFEEDRLILDYPMNKTWAVINKAISVLSDFRDRTEGIVCINTIGE